MDPEHLAEGSPTGPESPSPDTPDSRARVRPWGHFPSWKPIFLESLAEIPNVSGACRRAGINRAYAYEAREADPDFKASWDEALATSADALEESIWRRVINGESDRLAESLLRAHKPDLYGDKRTVELTGANGGPVQSTSIYVDTDEEKAALKAAIRRELERRGEPVPD